MTARTHLFIKCVMRQDQATAYYDDERYDLVKIWTVPASVHHPEEMWLQLVPRAVEV